MPKCKLLSLTPAVINIHAHCRQAHARPLKRSTSGAALSALARAFSRTPRGTDGADHQPTAVALPSPNNASPQEDALAGAKPTRTPSHAAASVQLSYFVMGTQQQGWRHATGWPPALVAGPPVRWYLAAPNVLQQHPPAAHNVVDHIVLPGQCPKVGVISCCWILVLIAEYYLCDCFFFLLCAVTIFFFYVPLHFSWCFTMLEALR